MKPRPLALAAVFLMLLSFAAHDAKADTIVVNAVQQGWYTEAGSNNGVPPAPSQMNNYFVGASSGQVLRNYFVFDLTYVTAITSAQLRIVRPGDSDLDTDPFETYVLYDVSTPAGQLGTVNGVSIFNDLGAGTVYASVDVPTPQFFSNEILTIDLNADALAALQSNSGLFAIGGAITTLREPTNIFGSEGLFAFSGGVAVQLIVNGQQLPVPEPATLLLLGTGLAGVAVRIRQRRRAA